MPTPINTNNNAYARHYKSVNADKASEDYSGVVEALKGSIDLPAFNETNQTEGFFTQHTTPTITGQAEVSAGNYYACLPSPLAGRNNDDE